MTQGATENCTTVEIQKYIYTCMENIMTESEISLFGKVVIAALIGLSVIWFTFSYQVQ